MERRSIALPVLHLDEKGYISDAQAKSRVLEELAQSIVIAELEFPHGRLCPAPVRIRKADAPGGALPQFGS